VIELLSRPWPWYVAGPLIGLVVPALLLLGNKQFGISANLRHACAIVAPGSVAFFRYDWRRVGGWNLAFIVGVLLGGFIAGHWLASDAPILISEATRTDLGVLGIRDFSGLVPNELFNWSSLLTLRGLVMLAAPPLMTSCRLGHARLRNDARSCVHRSPQPHIPPLVGWSRRGKRSQQQ